MIARNALKAEILDSLKEYPVTALIGPRQCGKTTIAKEVAKGLKGRYFDLEDPATPLQKEQSKFILEPLTGLVVIDEIQLNVELFKLLRVLADRRDKPARFLILGSASPS